MPCIKCGKEIFARADFEVCSATCLATLKGPGSELWASRGCTKPGCNTIVRPGTSICCSHCTVATCTNDFACSTHKDAKRGRCHACWAPTPGRSGGEACSEACRDHLHAMGHTDFTVWQRKCDLYGCVRPAINVATRRCADHQLNLEHCPGCHAKTPGRPENTVCSEACLARAKAAEPAVAWGVAMPLCAYKNCTNRVDGPGAHLCSNHSARRPGTCMACPNKTGGADFGVCSQECLDRGIQRSGPGNCHWVLDPAKPCLRKGCTKSVGGGFTFMCGDHAIRVVDACVICGAAGCGNDMVCSEACLKVGTDRDPHCRWRAVPLPPCLRIGCDKLVRAKEHILCEQHDKLLAFDQLKGCLICGAATATPHGFCSMPCRDCAIARRRRGRLLPVAPERKFACAGPYCTVEVDFNGAYCTNHASAPAPLPPCLRKGCDKKAASNDDYFCAGHWNATPSQCRVCLAATNGRAPTVCSRACYDLGRARSSGCCWYIAPADVTVVCSAPLPAIVAAPAAPLDPLAIGVLRALTRFLNDVADMAERSGAPTGAAAAAPPKK